MDSSRKRILGGMGAAMLVLGGAGLAWACTSQPVVMFGRASGSASGSAGSPVAVSGADWDSENVYVRWNSPTATPDLRVVRGPSFSTSVRIPADASPGVYTIYFVQYERDASSGAVNREAAAGVARLPFEVTPGAGGDVRYSNEADNSVTRTSSSTSGADDASDSHRPTTSASGGENEFSTGSGQRSGTAAGGDQVQGRAPASDETYGALAPGEARNPAGTTAASGQASSTPVASATGPGAVAAGQSAASGKDAPTSGGAAFPSQPVAPAPGDERPGELSPRTATSDVWAGFESGGASLVPGLGDSTASTSGALSTLALGVGLLGTGMGMMFAGFGVAEVRRQRALARQG